MSAAVFVQSPTTTFHLRQAHADDLPAINGIVERAIATWQLPERVKRLSLPSYRYHAHDLVHLHLVVVEDVDHVLVGVAGWETSNPRDLPTGKNGLLLHGLYVDPAHQHRGVGSQLLDATATAAHAQGFDGVLVKAQADANGFFEARGLQATAGGGHGAALSASPLAGRSSLRITIRPYDHFHFPTGPKCP